MMKELFKQENGDRPEVDDLAIVITDGVSTRDRHLTSPYAREAKERGIRILAVGIGPDINIEELESIASPPGEETEQTVFQVSDFDKLADIVPGLVQETCDTPPPFTLPPGTTMSTTPTTRRPPTKPSILPTTPGLLAAPGIRLISWR